MRRRSDRFLFRAAVGIGLCMAARAILRPPRLASLRGRNVLITGGARGLGLVLARRAVREGARVSICARDPLELEKACRELTGTGERVQGIPCDVTDREQVQQMVEQIQNIWGPIDVLINNAGTIEVGPRAAMEADDYERALQTHFWGPYYTIEAALPGMQRGGRIVNIASIGGKLSVPHLLPYSTSKFALVGYSEGLRAELARDGIVVTTVCPGLMRTGSPRNVDVKGQHQAEYALFSISDSLPLISMNADRAARQIIEACKRGDAEVILSIPAKVGAVMHGLFPGLTSDILGFVNRYLPNSGEEGKVRVKGYASESAWSPSILTTLTDRAAVRNNEIWAT